MEGNLTEAQSIDAVVQIRQSGPEGVRIEGLSYNPFARQVHVGKKIYPTQLHSMEELKLAKDNTESSIVTKVRNLTEMKADYLLKGRIRIIK